MKKLNKKGFTIVELVIVIAVIAILAAVLIPTFSGVVSKANASAALQTAKSTLTNALTMSSTAQLQEGTKIVVDGYAFNYTGNQMVQTDYVASGVTAYTLKNDSTTKASSSIFNAVIISADSLYTSGEGGVAVSNSLYNATDGATMVLKNDVVKILAANSTDNAYGCLASGTTAPTVTCIKSGTTAHYYVNYTEASGENPANYAAELYVNSDLDKDVVVFTVFGK